MAPAVAGIPAVRAVSRVVTSRKVGIGRQVWRHTTAFAAVLAAEKNSTAGIAGKVSIKLAQRAQSDALDASNMGLLSAVNRVSICYIRIEYYI